MLLSGETIFVTMVILMFVHKFFFYILGSYVRKSELNPKECI